MGIYYQSPYFLFYKEGVVMKNLCNLIHIFIILYVIFFISSTVSALTRGTHVVSKKGKELYLRNKYGVPIREC